MKKAAVLLVLLLLVACSDGGQQDPASEGVMLSADEYMTLDLMLKLKRLSEKNEQIIEDADVEAVQNYLKELDESYECADTTEEEARTAEAGCVRQH